MGRGSGSGKRRGPVTAPVMARRVAAVAALVVGAATVVLAVVVAVSEFPRGLVLLACVVVAGAAAWYGVLRRGVSRVVGLTVAGLALAGALVLVVATGTVLVDLLVVAGLLVSLALARAALVGHVDLPRVPAPQPGGAVLQPEVRRRARRSGSRWPSRRPDGGSRRSS